jgi:probable HAF family extracellular repeat protein
VTNLNRVAVTAAFAMFFSGLAFSQAVFSVEKVTTASPNSMMPINNSGSIVVNTGNSALYDVTTWDRVNGTKSLGLTGLANVGADIANSGSVVGAGDPDNSGVLQAFFWQPAGGIEWLGSLGGGLSTANGVNNSGAVVGFSYTAADEQHAFLWTQTAGLQDLTPAVTSLGGATAEAINSSNQVVGYYFPNGTRNTLGFFWTEAGGLQDIGTPGTIAYGINDSGTVVGQSPVADGSEHAFSWTQAGGITDLGTLGGSASSALGVNSLGWIVGTSLTNLGTGVTHGFLWTPSAGMQDFTTLAGLAVGRRVDFVQANDAGVIAVSTNSGNILLVPKMTGTYTSSLNPSMSGQPVTFTVTITSFVGPPPNGDQVEFLVGGQVFGTVGLTNGVAQFTTSAIPVGSRAIAVQYLGDTNYLPAKYTGLTQVVTGPTRGKK